ncbi:protein-L-isoaspartate O-methyltransferase family protein [Rubellimicrobium roseum]|uniref:Protein-L-isoaspartate O-methyltransferase n=1 Tax=Rubellimicrobium roseum TaxID=687525 RepID=A0A5C4NGU1_9RHOB|nr:protein-L-isoaspartate O-methyltransferase [Rubellimicrobium roseum]TNC73085.1 protein-L-isoaspartate O-methyltransferase [Rubellimicrobium roseum]
MSDFQTRRTMMVDTQVRPSEVTRFPIIEAMLHVPREEFVPESRREAAYLGENLLVAPGRVVLEPRTLGKFLEALDIRPGERVLDLATGLGYGAAVIARMGGEVIALEEDPALAQAASTALAGQGASRARVQVGPLAEGAPAGAPYDVILIEGAVEVIPDALLAQLAEDGRIAALFAEENLGTARIGRKEGGQVHWRYAFNAGAPVLPGFGRASAFVL